MAGNNIEALDGSSTSEYKEVTRTDQGSGKQALDVDVSGSASSVLNTTGTTDHFNGSVGTSAAQVPGSAGNVITSFLVENTHASQNILFSCDGGTTFKTVLPNDAYYVEPKGDLTQIDVKGSGASTTYEILMNRKA